MHKCAIAQVGAQGHSERTSDSSRSEHNEIFTKLLAQNTSTVHEYRTLIHSLKLFKSWLSISVASFTGLFAFTRAINVLVKKVATADSNKILHKTVIWSVFNPWRLICHQEYTLLQHSVPCKSSEDTFCRLESAEETLGCGKWNAGGAYPIPGEQSSPEWQPYSMHACEFTGLCTCFCMLQENKRPADRQEKSTSLKDRMPRSHWNSELPPDMDSNQTLTASCRADVWAGATFKPEDTERRGIDGREITVK